MKKKLLCLVLSLAMIAVFMPSMAFAESAVNNVVQVGTFNALQSAVTSHNENDVITLTDDIVSDEKLIVKSDTVIDLNGFAINAQGKHQVFSVLAGNLVLENGTVTGGIADREFMGGAIFVAPSSTLSLSNMTLTGNVADNAGGAIALLGKLKLAGYVNISGNTVGLKGKNDNVYVANDVTIEAYRLAPGSVVGVNVQGDIEGKVFATVDKASIKYFVADNSVYGVAYKIADKCFELSLLQAQQAKENNAKVNSDIQKAVAVAAITALKDAKEKFETAAINTRNEIAERVENTACAIRAGVIAAQGAAAERREAVKDYVGGVIGAASCATQQTAAFIGTLTKEYVVKPYLDLYANVNAIAEDTEHKYSETVELIAHNALLEVEKTEGNVVRNTVVLKTALQEIAVVEYAQDGAHVIGGATDRVLQSVYSFLKTLFDERN